MRTRRLGQPQRRLLIKKPLDKAVTIFCASKRTRGPLSGTPLQLLAGLSTCSGRAVPRPGGEALARWREDVVMEPDSYIILKQVWSVRNPEKFCDGDVNYDWQREPTGKGPQPTRRLAYGPA